MSTTLRKLLALAALPPNYLVVSNGRVGCPRASRRDSDVDGCHTCPLLKRATVDLYTGEERIYCSGISARVFASPTPEFR